MTEIGRLASGNVVRLDHQWLSSVRISFDLGNEARFQMDERSSLIGSNTGSLMAGDRHLPAVCAKATNLLVHAFRVTLNSLVVLRKGLHVYGLKALLGKVHSEWMESALRNHAPMRCSSQTAGLTTTRIHSGEPSAVG